MLMILDRVQRSLACPHISRQAIFEGATCRSPLEQGESADFTCVGVGMLARILGTCKLGFLANPGISHRPIPSLERSFAQLDVGPGTCDAPLVDDLYRAIPSEEAAYSRSRGHPATLGRTDTGSRRLVAPPTPEPRTKPHPSLERSCRRTPGRPNSELGTGDTPMVVMLERVPSCTPQMH